ncbi:MAG: precorrin-2 C(20)-methyltransferase [Methylococcaceae bacterium]|nr:MAG: precorrin-2 C(20)-methyltransferase [Methylococcaceae bacterium]
MNSPGHFSGVGVGPGSRGYISVAALQALQACDLIYLPKARGVEASVAQTCLAGLGLDEAKYREVEFLMVADRSRLQDHYSELAATIAADLRQGLHVGYVTLGDAMTYSTYGYTLAALRDLLPDLRYRSYPGVTSYAAAAAALDWPLGEGRERVLILPCPDDMQALRRDIESHDIVVLMKVAQRLPSVLALLDEMAIAAHCALVSHIGLPGEMLYPTLADAEIDPAAGYLTTLLIRRNPRPRRHR